MFLAAPFCDLTCPRQATGQARDCDCGGAQRHFEAWRSIGTCADCRYGKGGRCPYHRGL